MSYELMLPYAIGSNPEPSWKPMTLKLKLSKVDDPDAFNLKDTHSTRTVVASPLPLSDL